MKTGPAVCHLARAAVWASVVSAWAPPLLGLTSTTIRVCYYDESTHLVPVFRALYGNLFSAHQLELAPCDEFRLAQRMPHVANLNTLRSSCVEDWDDACSSELDAQALQQYMQGVALIVIWSGEPFNLVRYHPVLHPITVLVDCQSDHRRQPALLQPVVHLPLFSSMFAERADALPADLLGATHWQPSSARRFCAFLYTRCDGRNRRMRHRFFELLAQLSLEVDSLGSCQPVGSFRSVPGERVIGLEPRDGLRYLDSAVATYRNYRWVVAFENQRVDGYVTEKIVNAMLAGAVPIFLGASDVTTVFNPRSFVDCSSFASLDDCAKQVLAIDSNQTAYQALLAQPWFASQSLPAAFDWHPSVALDAASLVRQFRRRWGMLSLPRSAAHTPLFTEPNAVQGAFWAVLKCPQLAPDESLRACLDQFMLVRKLLCGVAEVTVTVDDAAYGQIASAVHWSGSRKRAEVAVLKANGGRWGLVSRSRISLTEVGLRQALSVFGATLASHSERPTSAALVADLENQHLLFGNGTLAVFLISSLSGGSVWSDAAAVAFLARQLLLRDVRVALVESSSNFSRSLLKLASPAADVASPGAEMAASRVGSVVGSRAVVVLQQGASPAADVWVRPRTPLRIAERAALLRFLERVIRDRFHAVRLPWVGTDVLRWLASNTVLPLIVGVSARDGSEETYRLENELLRVSALAVAVMAVGIESVCHRGRDFGSMLTVLVRKPQSHEWVGLVGAKGAEAVRYFLRSQLQLPLDKREAYRYSIFECAARRVDRRTCFALLHRASWRNCRYPIFEFPGAAELRIDQGTRPLSRRSGPRARLAHGAGSLVVVLVLCRPEDVAFRQLHRSTWIAESTSTSGGWKIVPRFMSGQTTLSTTMDLLSSEALRYSDVVILNVTDNQIIPGARIQI